MCDNILNKTAKKIYLWLLEARNEARAFRCARMFLRKGFYYIQPNKNEIKHFDKKAFSIPNIFHWHICWRTGLQYKEFSSLIKEFDKKTINYGVGGGKIVLMTQDKACGFYNTEKGYSGAKKSYINNYHSFNYPCVQNICFFDKIHCIVMDRIIGNICSDYSCDRKLIKKMLEWHITAKTYTTQSGDIMFLQHGDASRRNVLWVQNNPIFIDLDNIGYYPPLLDVFHYCCSIFNFNQIISILMENDELIKAICKKSEIDINTNYYDTLLLKYVNHYVKMNACFEDFKFLTVHNTKDYPKTNLVLQSIKK